MAKTESGNGGKDTGGVVVPRGAALRLSGLRIGLGPNGWEASTPIVEQSMSMAPVWLEIASRHLMTADDHQRQRTNGSADLHGEFVASMQAMVASAIALDAFHAQVLPFAGITEELRQTWRANRTARHEQVAETFRRAFRLKEGGTANLRRTVREVFRFRDLAVHPSSEFSSVVLHPELNAGVEWRFVAFRFENAKAAVRSAIAIVAQLSRNFPSDAAHPFASVCHGVRDLTTPLAEEWQRRYGPLTDDDDVERDTR